MARVPVPVPDLAEAVRGFVVCANPSAGRVRVRASARRAVQGDLTN